MYCTVIYSELSPLLLNLSHFGSYLDICRSDSLLTLEPLRINCEPSIYPVLISTCRLHRNEMLSTNCFTLYFFNSCVYLFIHVYVVFVRLVAEVNEECGVSDTASSSEESAGLIKDKQQVMKKKRIFELNNCSVQDTFGTRPQSHGYAPAVISSASSRSGL
jgi:hypothetical protein